MAVAGGVHVAVTEGMGVHVGVAVAAATVGMGVQVAVGGGDVGLGVGGVAVGGLGTSGSVLCATSSPSAMRSPSVSLARGLVL